MKKIYIPFLLLFPGAKSFAQLTDGSKVLTSTVSNIGYDYSKGEATSSANPTLTSKTSGFAFTTETTFGTIKNQHLFSYGLHLMFGLNKQSDNNSSPAEGKNHRYEIGPVISYQKFYIITDGLYYSPFSKLSIAYRYSKQGQTSFSSASFQKGIEGTFTFNPFSITFSKSPKTNFLFSLGTVWIDYTRTKFNYEHVLNDSKTISTTLTLSAQIGGIGLGIQNTFLNLLS